MEAASIAVGVLLILVGVGIDRVILYFTRKSKTKAFVLLSNHWEAGVRRFNMGLASLPKKHREAWYSDVDMWKEELYELLEEHVPERLGTVRTVGPRAPVQPQNIQNPKAVQVLTDLWATLEELKKVIEDYSPF